MKRSVYLAIAIAVLLGVLSIIPVNQRRVLSYGVDSFATHHPLFGNRTVSTTMNLTADTVGIGFILVDLHRSKQLSNVEMAIVHADSGKEIIRTTISSNAIQDDQFVSVIFSKVQIPKGTPVKVQLSAPQATNKNAIGVRFDPQQGLATIVYEKVPFIRSLITEVQNKSHLWLYAGPAALAAIIIGALYSTTQRKYGVVLTLCIIILAATVARMVVIPHFGGVSGGDAYNYLSIAQSIRDFKNPFINEKRLPGYPLLLTPAILVDRLDHQQVMRTVQIIAGAWALIALYFLSQTIGLSKIVGIGAVALIAFQKDFFWTSMRPEPYTLYTALFLTSLWLFFHAYRTQKQWQWIVCGVVLGYAAMTRQEGFLAALLIGIAALFLEWQQGFLWKRILSLFLPALLVVSPFLLSNFAQYGNLFYTPYSEGDRLQIVDSFLAFQDATGATWGILGSMWKVSWDQLERIPFVTPLFLFSIIAPGVWYTALRYRKESTKSPFVFSGILAVAFVCILLLAIYIKTPFTTACMVISAAWIIGSIPLFVWETKIPGLIILLLALSQIGIATWFHPFPKHYQQVYPLIALAISTALLSRISTNKKSVGSIALATFLLPSFLVAAFLFEKLPVAIDRQNANIALDSVTYRAARYARTLPGIIGFDQAYLPARLYFDPNAKYFPDEDTPTPAMEQQWLSDTRINYLIDTNANNVFKHPDPSWKIVKTFKAEDSNENIIIATIYELPRI